MSCDNSIYHTDLDLDACPCPGLELDEDVTTRKADPERHKSPNQCLGLAAEKSQSKGHRHQDQSTIIPDSTQTEPEYVWGDEGPIND